METKELRNARRAFEDACAAINHAKREGDLETAWVAGDTLHESFQELEELLGCDDDLKKRADYHYRCSRALRTLSEMESEPHKQRLLHDSFNLLTLIREFRLYVPERFADEERGSTAAFLNDVAQDMIAVGWFESAAEWAQTSLHVYEERGEAEGIAIGRLTTHLTRLQALQGAGNGGLLATALQEAISLVERVEKGFCLSIVSGRLCASIRQVEQQSKSVPASGTHLKPVL